MSGPLRPLAVPVFLPAAVFGIGQGAVAPVVALRAGELGASIGVAALVVALLGAGQVLGDLRAGQVVARLGERRTVLVSGGVGVVGVALSLLAAHPAVLGLGVALSGVSAAAWGLARQSFVIDVVPPAMRARALSTMAGSSRLGLLLGPFLGAAAVAVLGTRGGFAVQLVAVLTATALMAGLRDVTAGERGPAAPLHTVLATHAHVLATLGGAALLTGAARASRTAVLPLWAAYTGLDAVTTSLLFGVGAAVDVALSYPAGRFMDRRGRRPVATGSLLTFALAHLLLPAMTGAVGLGVVAVLMGVGNGLSNGLIMTLGADAAPESGRSEFLGAWRLCHDLGMLAGPLVVGAVAAVASLAAASAVMGGLSGVGAAAMARWVPRRTPAPAGAP